MIRTRIAPSPTGIPHIGTTRTALFNYLFAKHNKGEFILRLEDTDRVRFVSDAEKTILEILTWLGLQWDGEIFVQSKRLHIYKHHAEILKEKGLTYEEDGALRFKMLKEGQTHWQDAIGAKTINFENKTQEDFIIIKSDGYPTYNFANVIDDHLMGITHVIRGEEFISSTPKHIQLYKAFSWVHPVFAHVPVVLGSDHQKLSKRHGAKSALEYRNEGYLREAILNYMAFLGWSPGGDREILSLDEMVQLFELKDVNTSNAIFDTEKLKWMNQKYIQEIPLQEYKERLEEFYKSDEEMSSIIKVAEDSKMGDLLFDLTRTRIKTLQDVKDLLHNVYNGQLGEASITEKEKALARDLKESLDTIHQSNWTKDEIFIKLKEVMEKHTIRMPVLYKIFTGSERGLPLPESLQILGKDEVLRRLHDIIKE